MQINLGASLFQSIRIIKVKFYILAKKPHSVSFRRSFWPIFQTWLAYGLFFFANPKACHFGCSRHTHSIWEILSNYMLAKHILMYFTMFWAWEHSHFFFVNFTFWVSKITVLLGQLYFSRFQYQLSYQLRKWNQVVEVGAGN